MTSRITSLSAAFRQWPVWLWFARQDIRARYRGSLLGPLWLVLNLGILIGGLSIIYGTVFQMPLKTYVPYITAGFMAWWFISGCLTESCSAFITNSQLIANQPLPLGIYVLRVIARQVLLFAHNFIVLVVVAAVFLIRPNAQLLLFVPGFLLVLALLLTLGVFLAIVCARYRDIPHTVTNLLQISMFITPIMFMKDMLGSRSRLATWNPFYHMVDAIRAPLLGEAPDASTWVFLIVANVASLALTLWLMKRAGHRVPYLV